MHNAAFGGLERCGSSQACFRDSCLHRHLAAMAISAGNSGTKYHSSRQRCRYRRRKLWECHPHSNSIIQPCLLKHLSARRDATHGDSSHDDYRDPHQGQGKWSIWAPPDFAVYRLHCCCSDVPVPLREPGHSDQGPVMASLILKSNQTRLFAEPWHCIPKCYQQAYSSLLNRA